MVSEVYTIKDPCTHHVICTIVVCGCRIIAFATADDYQGKGYMRAAFDAITQRFSHLVCDCGSLSPMAESVVLGAGFKPMGDNIYTFVR